MMRRIALLLLSVIASVQVALADKEESVKLNDADRRTATVEFASGLLFLEVGEIGDDGNADVSISVENLSDTYSFLLFFREYEEKVLKKLIPSVRFDKIFAGTKGRRSVEACQGIEHDTKIAPSRKEPIMTIPVEVGKNVTCRLPVYFATYEEKKFFKKERYVLKEKYVVLLNIEVEQKPDSAYLRLSDEYRKLSKALEGKLFCTNRRHKPSLEEQKSFYNDWKEVCIAQIDSAMETLYSTDKRFAVYEELKQRFEAVDFEALEGDCGKHKRTRSVAAHRCKYCDWSLQQIYHRLDDYYQRIYSSDNRRAVKEQVMDDVKILYNCCTDKRCRRHAREWKNSEYRAKITDRYNRISRF